MQTTEPALRPAASTALPLRMKSAAAARYIGISRRFLAHLTKTGSLPSIRLGPRCCLYDRCDLDSFLASYRVAAAADQEQEAMP